MATQDQDYFQFIPASQFNPASLTGSFQPVFTNGFPDTVKILEVYNGATVAMDVSYDGVNLHEVWPAGATLIIDFQANHSTNQPFGGGNLFGRQGQNVWVRTSVNPTWLTVGGFK